MASHSCVFWNWNFTGKKRAVTTSKKRTDDMKSLVNNFKLWFLCWSFHFEGIIVLFPLCVCAISFCFLVDKIPFFSLSMSVFVCVKEGKVWLFSSPLNFSWLFSSLFLLRKFHTIIQFEWNEEIFIEEDSHFGLITRMSGSFFCHFVLIIHL